MDVKSSSDKMQETCPSLAVRIKGVRDVEGVEDLVFLKLVSKALQAGSDIMGGAKLSQAFITEHLLVLRPKDALTVVS